MPLLNWATSRARWPVSCGRGRGNMVGLIVPSVANPFWAGFARTLEAETLRYGYQLLLCDSERDPKRETAYVEGLWTSGVRTVVLATSLPSLDHLTPAIERGLQLITFDREAEGGTRAVVNVSVDNQLGGFLATNHLLSLGHRRIGFVSGAIATVSRRRRLAGYRRALEEAGVAFRDELVWAEQVSGDYGDVEGADRGKAGMTGLLGLKEPPTALVTINDMYAIGAIAAALDQGLAVPRDISVVGFDDIVFTRSVPTTPDDRRTARSGNGLLHRRHNPQRLLRRSWDARLHGTCP